MRPQHEYDEAMRWVALGLSSTETARIMGIPIATIKSWRRYGRGSRKSGPNHTRRAYREALDRVAAGMNDCEISRAMDIPHGTIRAWRTEGLKESWTRQNDACPVCGEGILDREQYSYLLGLYLGDGWIHHRRDKDVFDLRIYLDAKYPEIIQECAKAMTAVRTNGSERVSFVRAEGCICVKSYWKHWRCLFPQHGPGMKHERDITLAPWQQDVVNSEPGPLLRGLIHSDGCRFQNRVRVRGKEYRYPRYMFTNHSAQIRAIFCEACDQFGVRWTRTTWRNVAVSRRADVARLDEIIGPKR